MTDFLAALGLVLVIEGALYALFPEAMKRLVRSALEMPATTMRAAGLFSAVLGLIVVWLARG
jgi:uncharacterized protein YjeT (DUF2065 family)